MRRYETMVILDPDLGEDLRKALYERFQETMERHGGFPIVFDDDKDNGWGNRKMAYEIRKKQRGYYVRLEYCGDGDLVKEMERQFRIDDRVMRYMTVLLDEHADPEAIKAEIAEAQSQPESAAEAEEPAPAEASAPEETPAEPSETAQEATETEKQEEV